MWHFCNESKTLGYGDNRPIVVGETLTIEGEPKLCEYGLHASERLIDALSYALGPIVCEVELGGIVLRDDDKAVGTTRKVLWMADATMVLHEFACLVAEEALTQANVTDEKLWNAIRVKRAWIKGEASDSELDAARSATNAAAYSAARSAAYAAARSAAYAAAYAAVYFTANAAANFAANAATNASAYFAAYAAAKAAAYAKHNDLFTKMVMDLRNCVDC